MMAAAELFILMLSVILCGGVSIDQLILSAQNASDIRMCNPTVNGTEVVRTQLDLLFTLEDWQEMNREEDTNGRTKRKALQLITRRWPNGTIPYIIQHDNTFSPDDYIEIGKAFAEWQRVTCITFRPALREDLNRLVIQNGYGCASFVGMQDRPEQELILAEGCRKKDIIVHELGHVIGFIHEQCRPDRDGYVEILHDNIIPGKERNFDKHSVKTVNTYQVPYDYQSIMHYGQVAFSWNNGRTMRTIDPDMQDLIGKASGLSFRDITLANRMYGCRKGSSYPDYDRQKSEKWEILWKKLDKIASRLAHVESTYPGSNVKGMEVCEKTPLISGIKHGVKDSQLTASSSVSSSYDASRSRLDTVFSTKGAGAWCSKNLSTTDWIQVDFEKQIRVTTIMTQGRSDNTQWVTSYMVVYSDDGSTWMSYTELECFQEVVPGMAFSGNWDQNSVNMHHLQKPFDARFVRLYPKTWVKHMCLRWEIYGCHLVQTTG